MKNLFVVNIEDENYPLLAPCLALLRVCGVNITMYKSSLLWKITYILPVIQLILLVMVVEHIYEIWGDNDAVIPVIGIAMIGLSAQTKLTCFIFNQKYMKTLVSDLTNYEQNVYDGESDDVKSIITEYRNSALTINSRLAEILFIAGLPWVLMPCILWIVEVVNGDWSARFKVMFDLKLDSNPFLSSFLGYIMELFYLGYLGFIHAWHETLLVSFFSFITGQLKIIKLNLNKLFDIEPQHRLDEIERIHKKHLFLIDFSKRLDIGLRSTMFAYFWVASMELCILAIEFPLMNSWWLKINGALTFIVTTVDFLLVYWHGNEVMVASESLTDGAYNSEWYNQEPETRKAFHILMMGLNRPIAISAGPFHNITLEAYIKVLKITYTYFTLINQTST